MKNVKRQAHAARSHAVMDAIEWDNDRMAKCPPHLRARVSQQMLRSMAKDGDGIDEILACLPRLDPPDQQPPSKLPLDRTWHRRRWLP